MGLSSFDHYSTPTPYCSPSIDRSITTRLIESSNIPPKSSSRFAHTPEWADGLDSWSSSQVCTTKSRQFDFHRDLGLYLPRHEKPNSAPMSLKNIQLSSKLTRNHFPPERIQQLIKKEKDLLVQNDLSNQKLTIDNHPTISMNTFRQSISTEKPSTNEIRLPLRHITSKSSSPPPRLPSPPIPPPQPPLNQEALKCLLKEHLTSLLTLGASTINTNRSLNNIPQQIRAESKIIEDLIPTQQIKTSPLIFQQRSTLGLTVTPMDLSSQRNIQSVSIEKMAQQRNIIPDSDTTSILTTRPATQPAPPPPPPTHLYQQQQRVVLRKNLEGANSLSGDIILSNESAQPAQNTRKGPSQHRSSSKNGIHRSTAPTTTIELLPPIISGKRLHIPLANHRYL